MPSTTTNFNNELAIKQGKRVELRMAGFLQNLLKRFSFNIFNTKSNIKLGLYGPPNGGKSTMANRICQDWLGEEMSSVSHIAHETREITIKEQVTIKNKKGKSRVRVPILLFDTEPERKEKCHAAYDVFHDG